MTKQQKSYERQKKANNELSSTARNYFFQGIASFIFGIVILFTAEGSISYFLLNSTFILSWIFAIYFVFKSVITFFKLTYDEFCPKCGSVANKEIKDSEYINTTKKRKDGHDDLRYNKTGYTKNTYHYVCSKCSWTSMNHPLVNSRSIERKMKKDSEFRLSEDKELDKRLKKLKKDDPDFYDEIKDLVA